ncbi:MAG: pentapeptide repeat-containing protein [Gemmatimonadota bacterium]|nr:pentapeptide repeat-containing protein [Gemmatimonadota bacterium]
MRAYNWLKRAVPAWIWVTVLVALVLFVGSTLSYRHWDWLASATESGSTTVRNIALIVAGFVALILALWRGAIGERQASAAEQAVLDGRYQRGIEMLASHSLSARLGGIYSLRNLGESQSEQYHIQVMRVFCAFVRHPPPYDSDEAERDSGRAEAEANPRKHVHGRPRARADVQAVMDAIGSRGEAGIAIEKRTGFVIDLSGADLSWTYLEKADLSNADLTFANLFHAVFYEWRRGLPPPLSPSYLRLQETNPGAERWQPDNYANEKGWRQTYTANLSGADLSYANLTRARMDHVDLSGAQVREATLSGVWLQFANLRGTNLFESNLSPASSRFPDLGADLTGADLTDASLEGSNCSMVGMRGAILHGTRFAGAKLWAAMLNSAKLTDDGQHPPAGLTQEQLDQTIVVAGNYPDLKGVVDARTGDQLVWHDAIPHDEKLRRADRREGSEEDEEEEDGGEEEDNEDDDEPPSVSRI